MQVYNIFLDRLPKIDLHGFDRDSAIIATNDFIRDSIELGHKEILIIHGIGTGIIKNTVHETLSKNKNVYSYKLDSFNTGCTIIKLISKGSIKNDNEIRNR
jgi:DNA mismatch repair protein MutS2